MESSIRQGTVSFRQLEGSRVDLDLSNGLPLQNVVIVSAGRGDLMSLWLDVGGTDLIINKTDVLDVREATNRAA
jgi:hypothetical protein